MTTIETDAPASLIGALAKVQAEIPEVEKKRVGRVRSEKANYEYRYADLSEVSAAILPLLGKHGLAWLTQPMMTDHGFVLRYTLMHSSGEQISGEYPLPDPSRVGPQQVGSALTYARRYCLCAVTGVAPGEDDDDAAAIQKWTQSAQGEPRSSTTRRRSSKSGPLPGTTRNRPAPDGDQITDNTDASGASLPNDAEGTDDGGGYVTEGTHRRLMATFSGAGFKGTEADRARRLGVCSRLVGRDVTSTDKLTEVEARQILAGFSKHRQDLPGWLGTLLNEGATDGATDEAAEDPTDDGDAPGDGERDNG
jgi:hypothetical protein